MAYDAARARPAGARSRCGCATSSRRPAGDAARGLGARATPFILETTLGRALFNEALPEDYPFVDERGRQEAALGDRQRPRRALPEGRRSPRRWTPSRRPASTGRPGPGVTISIEDVVTPPHKAEILERLRGPGREGPEPVRARPDHRRRAPPGAHRDLDPGHQRGRRREMEANFPQDQPGLHDGQLRRPRKHDAGPADRRHAWPGGQPEGRDHPAADQVQLPRGPVRARVLHLDPRRPQGSGGHRAADRRLRLPHPSAGRRLAGRDHPRGGLRHRPRPGRCRSRPRRADGTLRQADDVETHASTRGRWPRTSSSARRSSPPPAPTLGDRSIDALVAAGASTRSGSAAC